MKIFLAISILIASTNILAEYECAGGIEACNKAREINRLSKITGKTCAGEYEACLTYLEGEYEKMSLEQEIESERKRLGLNKSNDNQCAYSYEDKEGKIHFINVCN